MILETYCSRDFCPLMEITSVMTISLVSHLSQELRVHLGEAPLLWRKHKCICWNWSKQESSELLSQLIPSIELKKHISASKVLKWILFCIHIDIKARNESERVYYAFHAVLEVVTDSHLRPWSYCLCTWLVTRHRVPDATPEISRAYICMCTHGWDMVKFEIYFTDLAKYHLLLYKRECVTKDGCLRLAWATSWLSHIICWTDKDLAGINYKLRPDVMKSSLYLTQRSL